MSSKHSSDFYYLEFKLKSGKKLTAPLLFPKTILPQNDQTELAREFKYSIQKYWLNDGRYARFMRFQLQNKPEKTSIEVDFNAASNKYSFPKLNLSFDVFFTQIDETDFIGFVPVLGIEALGANKEALMQNLEANIRQEFARSGRLKSVASILSTQWHEKVTSKKEIVEFEFHNFNELEQIRKGRKESLLKGLGHPMTSNAVYRVGMDQHEEKLQRAIQGKVAGCVLVVGPSGSGKSVLIRSSLVNLNQHTDVFETDAGRFFQGLMGASGWQGKLAEVCKELRENEKILYVKNLAALFEVGRYEGNSTSIGEFLRSYIERGELRLLTECSPEEAAYLEARYPGYLKAFHTVRIEQPENEEIRYIVIEKLNWLANSMNIVLEDDAVDEILQLHMRYAPYSGYPGKNLRFMESLLRNRKQLDTKLPLGKDAVIDAFCQESGMPRFMVDPSIPLRPDKLAAFFAKRVFGQDIARQRIGSLLLSVKTGLARSGKPIASLLFAGPTGVGKTELSKAIAEFIFGSQDRISRFDMSEYADPASVLRLTGDTQTSGEGLLTRQVRQQPFSVILFDELEKAHYSFFDLLLQITGEGRLTDARGQVADFCSSVIVMTSNLGAKDYGKASVGFVQATGNHADIEQHFREAVQGYFKPEMVNRFDDIIAFSPLDNSLLNQLANREIVKVFERVKQQNQGVQFKKSADSVNTLATLGFDARYGARHLQRTIRERVSVPLARQLSNLPDDLVLEISLIDKAGVIEVVINKQNQGNANTSDHLADEIAGDRRFAMQIVEGNYVLSIHNTLDKLNREQRRRKDKFWKDTEASAKLAHFEKLKDRLVRLHKEIQQKESDLLCQLLSKIDDKEQLDVRKISQWLVDWRVHFKQLGQDIYMTFNPEDAQCVFAIYGEWSCVEDLAQRYRKLLETMGLDTSFHTVSNNLNFKPYKHEKKKLPEKIIGMLIEVKGDSVYPYLIEEEGLHRVYDDKGHYKDVLIQVNKSKLEKYVVPRDANRKTFFKGHTVRRHLYSNKLEDKNYQIDILINGEAQFNYLKKQLDNRWFKRLMNLLESGEAL